MDFPEFPNFMEHEHLLHALTPGVEVLKGSTSPDRAWEDLQAETTLT